MRLKRFLFVLLAAVSVLLLTAARPAKKTVRVACIGDSITYGMTLEDRETESYPARLQQMLGEGYLVGNFGKNGATLLRHGHRPYMEQEEYRAAMQWPADIIVIHLGINDTDPRNWPNYRDEFVGDYLTLIDSLKTVSPDARVIVALMTPLADRHWRFQSGTKQWHDEIQESIKVVAELSGAELIDFHTPLYPYPQHIPDAIHPDVFGARLLAKTVYQEITGDYGGLQLSPLYTDNMVLQRGVPIDIHGTANAGEEVTVRLDREVREVRTGLDGHWRIVFDPMEAATGLTLSVSTKARKLSFDNVAVGEVWLCSGQSNMEFMLKQTESPEADIAAADDSDLRFYDMKARWRTDNVAWPASALDSVDKLNYFKETAWAVSSPSTACDFSAVGYWFGRMLRDSLHVPVGLICNAVGGSTCESWIDRNTLEVAFPKILENWLGNDFIQDWARGRAKKNLENRAGKSDRHPYQPCYLFEAGILPLDHYAIRGVIWYQGESNAHNYSAHEKLFGMLVDSWREYWDQPAMPFYYVQLSSLNRPSWSWFRDSQRRLLTSRPALGIAVTSDLGDPTDVHYKNKQPVGLRLARWALHNDYGFSSVIPSGPLVRSAVADGERVIVSFDYAEGLQVEEIPGQAGNDERRHARPDRASLVSFEVAEYEGCFYPAKAEIVGETVVLTCPEVKHPKLVRYAWEPFTRANLCNTAGLPASTFRIEVH
jgi:sialate O-acetylesterase